MRPKMHSCGDALGLPSTESQGQPDTTSSAFCDVSESECARRSFDPALTGVPLS